MKRILIPTLLSLFSSCTTTPWRSVSAVDEKTIFQDVTATANVSTEATSSVIVGDFDRDGLVDFIANKKLYKNVSTKAQIRFLDVTSKVNLQTLDGLPMFVDINNDGELDIITTKGQVFIQKKGLFKDFSKIMGLTMVKDAYTISFGDLDQDGWPDLIVGRSETYTNNKFNFVPPQIFMNYKGISFKDVSNQQTMQKFPAYTRGIVWADYNNDQKPDLYFSNYRLRENFLFQTYKGTMIDASARSGTKGEYQTKQQYDSYTKKTFGTSYGHTIGSAWADLNNDGYLDLWVSNLVHKFVGMSKGSYDYRGYLCDDSKIYKNSGAPHYRFTDMRKNSGLPEKPIGDHSVYKGDELWAHTTIADFDNDGLQDVYVTQVYNLNYAYSLLFKNKGNFKFENVSNRGPKLLDTYAGAWADFNNDGKMDLITSGRAAVNAPPRLHIYKNVYESNNNYIKFKLNGTKSGKNPVTTQVHIYHDKGRFMRQVEGVTGTHNQQNDPILHFGLGNVTIINKVEIIWSSGQRQVLKNVKINSTNIITEGK